MGLRCVPGVAATEASKILLVPTGLVGLWIQAITVVQAPSFALRLYLVQRGPR